MSEQEPPVADERPARPRRSRRRTRTVLPADPRGPQVLLGLVALVVLAILGGTLLPPAQTAVDEPAVVEPVDSSAVVCPEPGILPVAQAPTGTASTVVSATVVPDLPGQDRPGTSEVSYLGDAEAPENTLQAPGDSLQVVGDESRLPALEIATQGGLAPGLAAGQSTLGLAGTLRGFASTACTAPATSWWFIGGGSTAGRDTRLILVNPENTDAEVTVSITGPQGPVTTPSLRGIVVPAESRVAIRMIQVAPGVPAAAWHVEARSGRIVAGLIDVESDGFVARGLDWIPPSTDPATRVSIPGVAPGVGARQLLVYAPGENDTVVDVRIVTTDGSFVPVDLPQIEVPAQTVVAIRLDDVLEGIPATVELTADNPILAGVRQRHPGVDASVDPREETSYAASAAPITSIGAATPLPAQRGTLVYMWLTVPAGPEPPTDLTGDPVPVTDDAPTDDTPTDTPTDDTTTPVADDTTAGTERGPVTVRLRILPVGDGQAPPVETLTIPVDRVVEITLPRPVGAQWFTAVIEPVDGEVLVAHQAIRRAPRGTLFTGYPWPELRTTVLVPVVREDLGVAFR